MRGKRYRGPPKYKRSRKPVRLSDAQASAAFLAVLRRLMSAGLNPVAKTNSVTDGARMLQRANAGNSARSRARGHVRLPLIIRPHTPRAAEFEVTG